MAAPKLLWDAVVSGAAACGWGSVLEMRQPQPSTLVSSPTSLARAARELDSAPCGSTIALYNQTCRTFHNGYRSFMCTRSTQKMSLFYTCLSSADMVWFSSGDRCPFRSYLPASRGAAGRGAHSIKL
eukprot:4560270-Pleurochrysis_carterae.AAC.1